jgi:HlyD family secretion protein
MKLSTVLAAKKDLDRTIIRSPISGVITTRKIEVGQTLASLFQTPELFTIASDLSELKVEAYVNEADIGKIAKGQSASFKVDAFPDKEFAAIVLSISLDGQGADSPQSTGSNSYKVTLDVTDKVRRGLLPNMSALIQILVAEKSNTLRVPNAALLFSPKLRSTNNSLSIKIVGPEEAKKLQQTGNEDVYPKLNGRHVVWRNDTMLNSGIQRVEVKLGVRGDDYTEIVSGDIKPGDKVTIAELTETTDAK